MPKKTRSLLSLIVIISITLIGCVASVDDKLPSAQLPEIEVASQITLIASPSHPTAYLPTSPIVPGDKVQLIGMDTNAAWLLVLHDKQIGWMPSFYSRTNIGSLTPALVIAPLPDKCTNYLGMIQKVEEEWTSKTGGSTIVYGAIYRPQAANAFEDASLVVQIDGKGSTVVGGDYLHTRLTTSSSIVLFAFSIEDLPRASAVTLRLVNPGTEPVFFEAAFFGNDCGDEFSVTGASFADRLPIGRTRIPPPPTPPTAVASTPNKSAATPTPIVVVSGQPGGSSQPVGTPLPSATAVAPRFAAERLTINWGECTTLRWNAEGAQTVYLNGVSVAQAGTRRVCPVETYAYVLTIREPDGRRNDWWLNVEVRNTHAPVPGATFTPSTLATTAVPTTEVVTDPTLLNEYLLAILRFQQARKALLQTPNSPTLDDLMALANGEALEQTHTEVDDLAKQGAYAELGLQQLEVAAAVMRGASKAAVLAREKYTLRQLATKTGARPVAQEAAFDGKTIYMLVYLDGRWKVERVLPLNRIGS